ncbi:PcfJ domain-containing protein [Erysipelothrix anatis]|uniref:PcfJ domain-containing protein n=1 Tax=Erysipelothrix anatis TaxID=2683713 RepID=UPI0013586921|nr:PcfJ domain-containing protein [Erysipelothrix anatis]
MQAQHYATSIKPTKSFYKYCESIFSVVKFKQAGKEIATTERKSKRVKTVRLQSNTNFRNFTYTIYVGYVAATSKKIEIQRHSITRCIKMTKEGPREFFDTRLVNLTVLENNQTFKYQNKQLAGLGFYHDQLWFEQNIAKVISKSELKYTNSLPYEGYIEEQFIKAYKHKELIEALCNLGNIEIAKEVVSGKADMRSLNRNWIKKHKRFIKHGLTFRQILELESLKQFYVLNDRTLDRIKHSQLSLRDVKDILNYEKKNDIRPRKLLRYLDKHNRSLWYYKDYLRVASEFNYEMNHWKTLFPINLEQAHDNVMRKSEEMEEAKRLAKLQKYSESYSKIVELVKTLEYVGDDFSILIPKTLDEIIVEGKTLSHCVYGEHYLRKHSKLETLIIFIRKSNEINEPYFTAELSPQGEIRQVHGFGNENKSEKGLIAAKEMPKVRRFVEGIVKNEKYQDTIKFVISKSKKKFNECQKLSNNKNTLTASI